MTHLLDGKVAVITGGNSGVGSGIAQEFIAQGATVVITGRNQDTLDSSVAELGSKSSAMRADATSPAEMDNLLKAVTARHGRLDVFVANAGIGEHAPLGKITEEQFDSVVATNFKGVVFGVQSAVARMKAGGAVVIIGSTGSVAAPAGMSVYGGTKAALLGALHSWVSDIKGTGIRINILSPGTVDTPSLRLAFGKAAGEDKVAAIIKSIEDRSPVGRIGSAREIGAIAAFLASDAANYINGVELFADGGLRAA
ncbi:SDR family oxidoreductase [Sphingomonas koreensis]|nr:SDR family oxidoreductase [Sphingomonas koreensis]